ncbi:MAG: YHS domain-containing protein [Alphaproteobacteria bacterium]|nr:YHS domain-containing protein [Alphaproteobacteria bacterium]
MSDGSTARDPVCGMEVAPDTARARGLVAVHEGREWFFCGPRCRDRFTSDPAAYLTDAGNDPGPGAERAESYGPLAVIVGLILVSSLALALKDFRLGMFSIRGTVSYFMTGFFLVFAGFKLIDLRGFAEGYASYDLLAGRWTGYGYVYPFIELGFGLAMLAGLLSPALLWAEFAVMAFSGLGVALKLARGERFQCACLGTFLKVPLTKVTLVEDFGMAALALYLLFA